MTALVRLEGVVKVFGDSEGLWPGTRRRGLRAVDNVSLAIGKGECVAVVGESGSGKSTLARCALALTRPTAGKVFFDDQDLFRLDPATLRRRRRELQMVFQDPAASLSPRRTIGATLAEPLEIHQLGRPTERLRRVQDLLEMVELSASTVDAYPHELSGGQRQRVAIARALATEPRFLVADEPMSALDVSIRGQILNLLQSLRERLELTILLVSHDLALVERIADRVLVMYAGRIVERADTGPLLEGPFHPYTVSLLAASQFAQVDGGAGWTSAGEPPDMLALPTGCSYHPRCPIAEEKCVATVPPPVAPSAGREAGCFFPGKLQSSPAGAENPGSRVHLELSDPKHVGTINSDKLAATKTHDLESE